jgi:hypothetical protein
VAVLPLAGLGAARSISVTMTSSQGTLEDLLRGVRKVQHQSRLTM